jgi:hypothetical protein
LWHAKLYYVNTKKYLLFYAHIISRVETIITIFCLQFEGENKFNWSKPTQKSLRFKQTYEFAYCLRMINMLISLLIYLIHLIRRLFLFSMLIYLIPFLLSTFKKIISLNICGMQNYIMLTPKNTYFSLHILFQELKQLLLFFVYNLKGKIN